MLRHLIRPFLLHAKGEGSSTKREELEEGSRKLRRRRRSRHIVGEEKSVEKDSIRVSRSRSTEKHSDEHQIKLDTDRSFVLYPVGNLFLVIRRDPSQ